MIRFPFPFQVFFYPKDSTPGCTKEAQAFQADLAQFKKLGAEVIGISSDADHTAFVAENGLSMTLLSDIGGKVRCQMLCLKIPGRILRADLVHVHTPEYLLSVPLCHNNVSCEAQPTIYVFTYESFSRPAAD